MNVQIDKRVLARDPFFILNKPLLAYMKRKKIRTHITLQKLPKLSHNIPSNVVLGIFLSFSFVMTGLLLAACFGVAHTDVAHVEFPNRHAALEKNVRELVNGFPIEQMSTLISERNKTTASFLVGIAKKESNWGKRVPRSEDGRDCFNYWGYRGEGSRGIAMGHACFGSPEEAIGVVGGRIDTFVREYHFDTAEELIVWKCGWSCDGHSSVSVKKWIADVGYYSRKVKI